MLHPVDSRGEEWTEHWDKHGEYSQIDYILASPSMERCLLPRSEGVYDGPGVATASDHRPVCIKLNTTQLENQK
jgi:endonuclease/exonuclease/phosphatase family metal-dependent hydrolase